MALANGRAGRERRSTLRAALGLLVLAGRAAPTASLFEPTRPLQLRERATRAFEGATRTLATLRSSRALLARSEAAVAQLAPKLLEDTQERARAMAMTATFLSRQLAEAPERASDEQLEVAYETLRGALDLRSPGRRARLGRLARGVGSHLALLVLPRPPNRFKEAAALGLIEAQAAYDEAELRLTKVGRLFLDGAQAQHRTAVKAQQLDALIEAAEANLERALQRLLELERRSQALQALRLRAEQLEAAPGGAAGGGAADAGGAPGAAAADYGSRARRAPAEVSARIERWLHALCERYEAEAAALAAAHALLSASVGRADAALARSELERYVAVKGLRQAEDGKLSDFLFKGERRQARRAKALRALGLRPDETRAGLPPAEAASLGPPVRKPPLLLAAALLCRTALAALARQLRELAGVLRATEFDSVEQTIFYMKLCLLGLPPLVVAVKLADGLGHHCRFVILPTRRAAILANRLAAEAWMAAHPLATGALYAGFAAALLSACVRAAIVNSGRARPEVFPPGSRVGG